MTKKRLAKAMAAAGVASRRKCEELIFAGRVKVNGKSCLLPQTLVNLDEDRVQVDGAPLHQEEEKVCFLLHKPIGLLCSNKPIKRGDRLVVELFDHTPYRLFTVGRLDRDTSGLLLVTNDGALSQRIIHPSANIEKEYIVDTNAPVSEGHLRRLRKGCLVEGVHVTPVSVKRLADQQVSVIVKEGRKREVRCLIKSVGLQVDALHRLRIGGLVLPRSKPGTIWELKESDLDLIFNAETQRRRGS